MPHKSAPALSGLPPDPAPPLCLCCKAGGAPACPFAWCSTGGAGSAGEAGRRAPLGVPSADSKHANIVLNPPSVRVSDKAGAESTRNQTTHYMQPSRVREHDLGAQENEDLHTAAQEP